MKVLTVFLLALLSYSTCYAQTTRFNKKDSQLVSKIQYVQYYLDYTDSNSRAPAVPFQEIILYDVRFDTSFIALYWQSDLLKIIRNRKVDLSNGFKNGITNYLTKYFEKGFSQNKTQLICYIKKFALTGKDTLLEEVGLNESVVEVKFEAECYYKANNLLYPAVRFDTTFTERSVKIKKSFSSLLKEIIAPFTRRLSTIDSLQVIKRRSYSENEIEERYKSRFNLPILTSSYAKGVFANFREFKNNSPSIKEFTIKKARSDNFFLLDKNENVINPFSIFGFSDGETCWLQSGDFSIPLIRVGNSFEYFSTFYLQSGRSVHAIKLLFALDLGNETFK